MVVGVVVMKYLRGNVNLLHADYLKQCVEVVIRIAILVVVKSVQKKMTNHNTSPRLLDILNLFIEQYEILKQHPKIYKELLHPK